MFFHTLGNAGAYGPYTNGDSILGPIYSASINVAGATVDAGIPQEVVRLLALRFAHPGGDFHTCGVSADGQRFLTFQQVVTAATTGNQIGPEPPVQGLTVAMHWMAGLKK